MRTKVDNIFLNNIKETLMEKMNEVVKYYNIANQGEEPLTLDRIVGETHLSLESIAQALEKALGVQTKYDGVTWKSNAFCRKECFRYIEIGTQRIEITAVKSLNYIVDEIMVVIREELLNMEEDKHLLEEIIKAQYNSAFFVQDKQGLEANKEIRHLIAKAAIEDEIKDIPDFIARLGKARYCDEEFVLILEKLGYPTKKIKLHSLNSNLELRCIDITEYFDEGTLLLDTVYHKYTMFINCKPRMRTEVLVFLYTLCCDEGWYTF